MKNIGKIKVTKIKENKDGSANITFVYDKMFANLVKEHYGKKRLSKKMITKYVKEAMEYTILQHSDELLKELERGIK